MTASQQFRTAFASLILLASPRTLAATYSPDEVAKHATKDDCWMSIEGKVYDVTAYLVDHPASMDVLLAWCGKDATVGWKTKGKVGKPHSRKASLLLKSFLKGDLGRNAK